MGKGREGEGKGMGEGGEGREGRDPQEKSGLRACKVSV